MATVATRAAQARTMVSQDTMTSLARRAGTTVEAPEEARERTTVMRVKGSTTVMKVRGSAQGAMAADTMPKSGKKQ